MLISYAQALEDGFYKKSCNDAVFFARHGFDYFYLELILSKKRFLHWSPENDGQITLFITDSKGINVEDQIIIDTVEKYKLLLKTFRKDRLKEERHALYSETE